MRTLTCTAMCVLMALAATGCKRKTPDGPPDTDAMVQSVKVSLQVTSVAPSAVPPNKQATVRVYGSAFADGARVQVGQTEADKVRMLDPNTLVMELAGMSAGTYDVTVTLPDGERSTLRGGLDVKGGDDSCRLVMVPFDFNSQGLRPDAKSIIQNKAPCLASTTGTIRVEGHADERGTTEYNLALGARRADSVKAQLGTFSIPGSRVQTVSYGEERPAMQGSNETAWAANRRVEIKAE